MSTRAKFTLTALVATSYGNVDGMTSRELKFSTRYDPTIPEDQRFTKASPSGSLSIVIDNPAALAFFEGKIGKAFYLDFTEAPEPAKS
jgi:hypothetical protein